MEHEVRITIKDIAKKTNLSIATVSRVLSNTGEHNSATEKKVREAAAQMGYIKNTAAAELVQQTSHIIAVIVSNTKSNFSDSIISAIEDKAVKSNLDVFVLHADHEDTDSQVRAIKTVSERAVKGIILVSLELDDSVLQLLTEANIPCVCLSTDVKNTLFPFVTSDNFKMGYDATNFLIAQGHQKIGFAGIPAKGAVTKRTKGYVKCMQDHGLIVQPDWIQYGDFTYDDGIVAMTNYMHQSTIDAVVCASDLVGVGLMNTAIKAGIQVPADLSIISIDGTSLVDMVRPRLTSVTQQFYEMGQEGINFLLGEQRFKSKYLPFKIVERDSTKSVD